MDFFQDADTFEIYLILRFGNSDMHRHSPSGTSKIGSRVSIALVEDAVLASDRQTSAGNRAQARYAQSNSRNLT